MGARDATLKPGKVVEVRGAPPENSVTVYRPKSIIIATGSVPIQLPFLPFDEDRVLSNIGALVLAEVPERLIVIGGGVIGVELGSVWRRLGAKVTIIELLPSILAGYDTELAREADKAYRKQGLDIRTGTKVTGARRDGDRVIIDVEKEWSDRDARRRIACSSPSAASRRSPASMRRRSASRSVRAARSSSTIRCGRTFPTFTRSATRWAGCCSRTRPRMRGRSRPR